MSSSDKSVKPKTGGSTSTSTGTPTRGAARPSTNRASSNRSSSASSRTGATNRSKDVSPGTQKVIQAAALKKQMERFKRNMEKEKLRKGGLPPKSTQSSNASRTAPSKKVNASKSNASTANSQSTPKNTAGKSLSRNNSKPELKQTDSNGVLKGVPTRRARIINSTPTSSGKNTPSKLTGQNSMEDILSPIAKDSSHLFTEDQGTAKEIESPKKERLTKQDRVNSDDQKRQSRNSSDLDPDSDNILAAALARLGSRDSEEDQQLQKTKVSVFLKSCYLWIMLEIHV